jgi:topoisomerase IA-like protein
VVQKFIGDLNKNNEEVVAVPTADILNAMGPQLFETFNLNNECKKCSKPAVVLAVKMSLFFKCTQCNFNLPLDNLLNEAVDEAIGEKYTVKNSIYGVYITNNETKKNISLPSFIDHKALQMEDIVWFDTLPLSIGKDFFLKVGKYGFYLERDGVKVPIGEKSLEVIKSTENHQWEDLFMAKKDRKPFKKTKDNPTK